MFTVPAGMLKQKGSSIPDVPFERWILQSPATSPPARFAPDMAFYPGLGVIMCGGTLAPVFGAGIGDPYNVQANACGTWVWTGTDWYKLAVITDSRNGFSGGMAYDSDASILVRSVAYDSGSISQWSEFDGSTWTNFTGAPQGGQIWCKVAYDKVRQRTFLDGRWSGNGTWDYNSTTNLWSNSGIGGGTAGYGYGMCFDEYSGKVLSALGQLYRAQYFDGAVWSSAGWPGSNPGIDSLIYGEAVWHPVRQTAIIKTHNETWEWNPATNTLSQMTLSNQGPAYGSNAYLGMAFDYANGVMVLFGGGVGGLPIDQTWVSGPL